MAKSVWAFDPTHSSVGFSVKHMMISTVRGTFHKLSADINADPDDLTTADITLTIDVSSIDTRDENRDGHLKSGDFFDVEQFPNMTFRSTKIERAGGNEYTLTGDLTIRGVTKPVQFKVEFEGAGKDPWGGERAGFTANATINRSDFGLSWNAALETGGVLVSDHVKLHAEIEAVKQA